MRKYIEIKLHASITTNSELKAPESYLVSLHNLSVVLDWVYEIKIPMTSQISFYFFYGIYDKIVTAQNPLFLVVCFFV